MNVKGVNNMITTYAGVGARKTPNNVLTLMTAIAYKMALCNFTLRSGGALGADTAFEQGAGNRKEIFYANDATPEAIAIAKQFHPAWHKLSEYPIKLHGRNSFQVLGRYLDTPANVLICWTPDACKTHAQRGWGTGGTGTAISIADAYQVPIVNLAHPEDFNIWETWSKEV